jgi:signal transduction histidine kinase
VKAPTLRNFDDLLGQAAGWIQRLTFRKDGQAEGDDVSERVLAIDRETVIQAPSERLVQQFQAAARWAGILAMLAGYHILLGWAFNISVLKSPGVGFAQFTAAGAVCAILCGLGLYVLDARWIAKRLKTRIVGICAGISVFIAAFSLDEKAFGWHPSTTGWIAWPMTSASAIGFILIGTSLLLVDGLRTYRLGELLALVSAAFSTLSWTIYLYRAETLPQQMTVYASVITFMLAAGVMCARPDRGFMAKITSDSFGGMMARRLLPASMIIPIILGMVELYGQHTDWYPTRQGVAVFTILDVIVFVGVVWWGVNSLHRMDTIRRKAENELKQTADKLARSNADLEQFAYVASHDLKEPLRAISGSVQILQQQYHDNSDADEVIQHTVDGATRMQRLIDDLLTYSRLTTREAPLQPTDANVIFNEARTNLESAIRESKAQVTSDALPSVSGDQTQLLQVIQNLIANGIKYRSERTPKIHVSAEENDNEWVFSVRDNGIGIAPQYAQRIFRIFQRLHSRREYSGTGIGLAVCKKIIERHGGRIWVESEPEEGSTFFFTLPKYGKQEVTEGSSSSRVAVS